MRSIITFRSNAKELSITLKKINRSMRNKFFGSVKDTAFLGERIAKALAPYKTGRLKEGIYSRVYNDKAIIRSGVPGPFPYHLWVNQTSPFKILKFRKRNKYFATPQDVAYGQPAISRWGNLTNWTGMPGYMDVTAKVVSQHLVNKINQDICQSLKG